MNNLKNYPDEFSWLTIFEVWNNRTWGGTPNAYRLTVSIIKTSAESQDLIFRVKGDDHGRRGYTRLWTEINEDYPIPVGQWLDLEFYLKEGDNETGRFYMTMTPEGAEKIVLFDLHEYTHNSSDPAPNGISLWNPIKLYTSWDLATFAKENDKTIQVYWDDLAIWRDKKPEALK
jgi:hypothetical protein